MGLQTQTTTFGIWQCASILTSAYTRNPNILIPLSVLLKYFELHCTEHDHFEVFSMQSTFSTSLAKELLCSLI